MSTLNPAPTRIAIVLDNASPHLSTRKMRGPGTGRRPAASSWPTPHQRQRPNRIEPQFTALRYFILDGTDHHSHAEQASMIRHHVTWRNRHSNGPRLRSVVNRAKVA